MKKTANRRRAQREAGQYYKRKFKWANFCIYCGQQAHEWDHVYPLSRAAQIAPEYLQKRRNFSQGLNLVPSCGECNRFGGSQPFTKIKEKRAYIKKRMAKKYKKWLKCTIWEKDEIEELGRNLRADVMKSMNNRNLVELRLSWPYPDTWVDPEIFLRK